MHVSTAESTMLQNALMWKVNQEFAHAQQTLDEIRCVFAGSVVWCFVFFGARSLYTSICTESSYICVL